MRGGVSCCFMCGYSIDMSISNYLLTYLLIWSSTEIARCQGLSFVMRKISTRFRLDHRQRERPNAGRVGNNCVFRPVEKSLAHMPYRWKLVSIRHCGSRPRRCAGGGIRGVINKTGGGRTLIDHSYGPVDINKVGSKNTDTRICSKWLSQPNLVKISRTIA